MGANGSSLVGLVVDVCPITMPAETSAPAVNASDKVRQFLNMEVILSVPSKLDSMVTRPAEMRQRKPWVASEGFAQLVCLSTRQDE